MPYVGGNYLFDFDGGGAGESYVPDGITAYPAEVVKVALPDPTRFPKPRLGYPCVLRINFSGFTLSNMLSFIGPGSEFEYAMLNTYGIAIAYATVVKTKVAGPPDVPGNALFFPEGFIPPGWTGNVPPGDDVGRPIPERDVEFAVQYLRHNAMRFGINPYQIGGRADSAGMQAMARAGLGPDRKYKYGTSGQHLHSTRLQALVHAHFQWYWQVFIDGYVASHFANMAGGPTYVTSAPTMADTFDEARDGASPSLFEDTQLNASLPMLMWSNVVPDDTSDFTIPHGPTETDQHTGWHTFSAHVNHEHWTQACIAAVAAAVPSPPVPVSAIVSNGAFELYAAQWMSQNLKMADTGYEVFDLISEEPRGRITVRRGITDGMPFGPRFVRQADHRKVRTYDVTIRQAQPLERQRLSALNSKTRAGNAPMLLPHQDDGWVHVTFDEPQILYRQLSARATDIRVRLREFIGA